METERTQPAFETVVEALNWLKSEGYTHDFNIEEDGITHSNGSELSPNDFSIDYVFRFEGDTDPGDENIVYAINSTTFSIRGVLINAFGIYADSLSQEMIEKLSTH